MVSKVLTVKWTMDDGIIKFKEEDTVYDISDAAFKYLQKTGISNNDKVSVEIDETEGDNGTVVKISKADGEAKKETPKNDYEKTEVKEEITNVTEVLTVKGISWKNKGVTFKEKEDVWFSFENDDLLKSIGVSKGDTIQVTYEPRQKGNDFIVLVQKQAVEKSEQSIKNDYETKAKPETNTVQRSIECQACVNSANHTVSTLFSGKFDANNPEDGTMVKNLISSLAKHNFQVLQELKNS